MNKVTDQIERLDELETLVADFIELNRELVNENRVLREKQKKLILSILTWKGEQRRLGAELVRLSKDFKNISFLASLARKKHE